MLDGFTVIKDHALKEGGAGFQELTDNLSVLPRAGKGNGRNEETMS
jgi:hypothetical protein